jgi:hypothetical protein
MASFHDSWQTRAEKAAERRTVSKENKHQRDRRRLNKSLAQGLLNFLQEKNHSILLSASTGKSNGSDLNIHLWTDSAPTGHPFTSLLTDEEDDNFESASSPDKRKGRPRSNSHNERPPASPKMFKNGRNRSNSDAATPATGSSKKQKGRPRSGSTASDHSSNDDKVLPRLCSEHFFGDCPLTLLSQNGGNRRKSVDPSHIMPRCPRGFHPSLKKGNPSLSSILLKRSKAAETKNSDTSSNRLETNRETLALASKMAKASLIGGTDSTSSASAPGSMEMLYHLNSKIPMGEFCYSPETHSSLLMDEVSNVLAKYECSAGNVVYLTINDIMVFDRYRDGIVLRDADEDLLLYGGSKRRSVSMGEYADGMVKGRSESFNHDRDEEPVVEEVEDLVVALHQRLVQYLPGNVLEYILSYLPESATAHFPRVCKAWHNEIGNSSRGLWTQLMDRNRWPHDHVQAGDFPIASTAPYRDAFIKHYKAVRDVNAIMQGLVYVLAGTDSSVASKDHKDVALFDFKDTIGRPISGETFVRMWSPARVLVGSGDCSLHLYDIVDINSGIGKRCKQSVRVVAAPFSSSKKRSCRLVGLDLDNYFIGCLYKAEGDFESEFWFSLIERDDLLCAGKGGSHISHLEDESTASYNMKVLILDYLQSSGEEGVTTWLQSHFSSEDEVNVSSLEIDISKNFVACGNGEFLFEAHVIYWFQDDEQDQYARHTEPLAISKIFLFSSGLGRISWVSPNPFNGTPGTFTLCKLRQDRSLSRQDATAFANAAFILGTGEIVKLEIQGPSEVRCTPAPFSSDPKDRPSLVGLSENHILLLDLLNDMAGPGTCGSVRFLSMDGKMDFEEHHLLHNNNFRPVIPLRKEYLIVFGSRVDPLSQDIEFGGTDEEIFATLYHVPSRQQIHTVKYTHKLEAIPRFSFSTECQDGTVAVSIDGFGLVIAGHDVSYLENETWERKIKRKKGARTTKGKKDYFARGMQQSTGYR